MLTAENDFDCPLITLNMIKALLTLVESLVYSN